MKDKPLKTVEGQILDKFYTYRKNEYERFSRHETNADTFKSSCNSIMYETITQLNNHYKELFDRMMDNLEKTGNTFGDFELLREELAKELNHKKED